MNEDVSIVAVFATPREGAALEAAELRAKQAEWTRDLAQAASSRDALEKQRLRAELAAALRAAAPILESLAAQISVSMHVELPLELHRKIVDAAGELRGIAARSNAQGGCDAHVQLFEEPAQ